MFAAKFVELAVAIIAIASLAVDSATDADTKVNLSSVSRLPIRGPSYVCNPRCAGYAEQEDLDAFLGDRCCVYIPCPKPTYDRQMYASFKSDACRTQ